MKYDCLVVDDEQGISQTVSEYFNMFDISTYYVTGFSEGLAFLAEHQVSVLLLDVNLGKESGFLFCKHVRKTSDIPIIFISARTSEEDILSGLSLGGDDYITKPFSMSILLAKTKAVLKRNSQQSALANGCSLGKLKVERAAGRVTKNDEPVKLKPMEWKLLQYFIDNQNRVISKDELLNNVWGDEFVSEGTLSVHVRHLREKIEDDPNEPKLIKTVWGTGYICGECT